MSASSRQSKGSVATPAKSASEALRCELDRVSRILLVRLRSLGDSILTLPLLEAFHIWRPDLALDVLIESSFQAVFSHHPAVHETLVLKSRPGDGTTGWSRSRALAEIRKRRYPVVVNLHGGATSTLLTAASGARFRVGQASYRRSWAYNVHIPPSAAVWEREAVHTVEHQLTLLRWLKIPISADVQGRLHLADSAACRVEARLREAGILPGTYVLVHPTATLFTKQWNPEHFAKVADTLAQRHGWPFIFTAARHEGQVLLDIGRHAERLHHYRADLDLEELFALIRGCRLFIGNDSGPTHAASALNRPVCVVWGSSNFRAWHPWRTDFELVRSDLPCMPCPGYTCAAFGDPRCIREISVERVLHACERLLSRSSAGAQRT